MSEENFDKLKDERLEDGMVAMLRAKRRHAIEQLPRYRGEVNSKNNIRSLKDVEPGQIFWVNSDNKAYLVAEKKGRQITIKALDETATMSTGITLYDMNRGIVSKEPLFKFDDEEAVKKLKERLWKFFNEDTMNEFYLLYGRDIHYLTLFQVTQRPGGEEGDHKHGLVQECELDALMESLENVGGLISMDFNTSDGEQAIEIWLRTPTNPAELLYCFPYDKGLVRI